MGGRTRVVLLLVVPLVSSLDTAVGALLQNKIGLTRREAELVQHRHRKRHQSPLTLNELEETIEALPPSLLPGHVAELLRSTSLPALREMVAAQPSAKWCSYKKTLCDCGARSTAAEPPPPPRLVAIDCEFKPLRCAAVDDSGSVVLDCVVTPDKPPAGRSTAPLPSILRCDRPNLVSATAGDVRERLRDLLKSGATIVAHTPQSDLRALGFDEAEYSEVLPSGVVDVARLRLPNDGEYHEVASLRRMAKAHLKLERFQRGGARHCAIQDALVTLRIYQALTDEESEAGESSQT